ncbi:olfactory receptor 1020-like [Tachyglossus aculeatus]|uniref:olfactory receptor 1020-like n=1 Tax=Tachyglossus aculeatus TaxID=9261 RepID=UPI0018F5B59B|nr:olfactory receptor 1020-like [Tachyglossus aculeatus]
MADGNASRVTGFLLMGLLDWPEVRFVAFDIIYSATLLPNDALLLSLRADHRLHTSMYFFLANLSLLDITRPTAAVPEILWDLATRGRRSRWPGAPFSSISWCSQRGWMSSSWRSRPLTDAWPSSALSATLFSWTGRCASRWPSCFPNSALHASFTFKLIFGCSDRVDQYYCDVPLVTVLSRSGDGRDRSLLHHFRLKRPRLGCHLEEPLVEGKSRAWSTFTSCLLALGLFYSPAIFTYIRPSSGHSSRSDGLVGMLYGVLNPLIDSLRNEEVLRELLRETLGPLGSLRHP